MGTTIHHIYDKLFKKILTLSFQESKVIYLYSAGNP